MLLSSLQNLGLVEQVIYENCLNKCDNRTILHGKQDLDKDLSNENDRIREVGAGRKPIIETSEGIDEAFLEIIEEHTAGSPMDETIKWTNLSRQSVANKLKDKGFPVSVTVVDQLLAKHKFSSVLDKTFETGRKYAEDLKKI